MKKTSGPNLEIFPAHELLAFSRQGHMSLSVVLDKTIASCLCILVFMKLTHIIHTFILRAAKALTGLLECADSSESSLVV